MSRSYRKPYAVDGYGTKHKKFMKNYANRVVRNISTDITIPTGNKYRRYFPQYDICDYKFKYSLVLHTFFNCGTGGLDFIAPTPKWKAYRK